MLKPYERYIHWMDLWYGYSQLIFLGLHIGHVFKKSVFFARWILEGIGEFFSMTTFKKKNLMQPNLKKKENLISFNVFNNSNNQLNSFDGLDTLTRDDLYGQKKEVFLKKLFYPVFIIKFWRIIFGLRVWMRFARTAGTSSSCGWFVCHNHTYMAIAVRYALLLGMGYSVFDWIAGCLTNFKVIFSLFFLLYREFVNGYLLEKKHYSFIYRLLGFNLTGLLYPSFIFLPRMLDSRIANYEGGSISTLSFALVDSNALSGDTLLPLPSNDDSFRSINFFFYLFCLHLLRSKLVNYSGWVHNIRGMSRRSFYWISFYFTFFYRFSNYELVRDNFMKLFFSIEGDNFFLIDPLFLQSYLSPYNVFFFSLQGIDANELNVLLVDTVLLSLQENNNV